ncbi:Zinc finger CCCH domain-containing protein 40 [Apostasia shenzhenica]|uniref:Zinc finger CCCH domain-containing protein 40 n=1 Tax=Apostasia shenzhenica TaxID=1088818 RepID=A0A2I0BDC0_9ASPA|nr:Zinc finger CCCH domain-containing protein 40 [Apostasia shenzhenica]
MAHRLLRDAQADGWERSDFPIICESCLGDNPYVRMTIAHYDKECKICTRPFTVFRWRPGRDARFKKTEICQTCSKLKNVCQVCLLDLEYGLPVQVRDTALSINSNDAIPKSDVNREYFAEEHDRRARAGIDYESSYGKVHPNDTILKLQRTTPYYKRNRAHYLQPIFWMRCAIGREKPWLAHLGVTRVDELSAMALPRVNDPVALKLLSKAGEMSALAAPDDESIKTLYVGGLDARITEQDLKDHFYAHGEIESIRMVLQRACAFVTYTTREGAERAAEDLSNKLVIKGLRLKLMWGKPQAAKPEGEAGDEEATQQGLISHGGLLPRAVISQQQSSQQPHPPGTSDHNQQIPMHYFNIPLPPPPERSFYPSMDPQRMGALVRNSQESNEGKAGSEKQPAGPGYPPPPGPPPMPGGYPSYYPPYAYMAPPPPQFQQPPQRHHTYPPIMAPPRPPPPALPTQLPLPPAPQVQLPPVQPQQITGGAPSSS